MQYSIPNKGVLPVGTIMQFPTGAQPSDYSLLVEGQSTTDNQWQSVFNFNNQALGRQVFDAICFYDGNTPYYFIVTDRGVMKSTNGIDYFYSLYLYQYKIYSIIYNPNNGALCATSIYENSVMGVYISTDKGVNWVKVSTATAYNDPHHTFSVCYYNNDFIVLSYSVNEQRYKVWKINNNTFIEIANISAWMIESLYQNRRWLFNKSIVYEENTQKCYFVTYTGSSATGYTSYLYSCDLSNANAVVEIFRTTSKNKPNYISLYKFDNDVTVTIGNIDANIFEIGVIKNSVFNLLAIAPYRTHLKS